MNRANDCSGQVKLCVNAESSASGKASLTRAEIRGRRDLGKSSSSSSSPPSCLVVVVVFCVRHHRCYVSVVDLLLY